MVDAARGVKVPPAATGGPWILIPEVASGEPGEEQPVVDRLGVYMTHRAEAQELLTPFSPPLQALPVSLTRSGRVYFWAMAS
jgi:hypothetical protein